jgi:CheY-like chemotaxis protein
MVPLGILLVDDDLLVLAFTAELLAEQGYVVTTARNGREALAKLEDWDGVDVLVTDVQMPGMHGFELARRAKELRPSITILYCTGRPEMIHDGMGRALGPVVRKPCSVEGLHREIQRTQI